MRITGRIELCNKVLDLLEMVKTLDEPIKSHILLYSNLTDNDFDKLILDLKEFNDMEFVCDECS